MWWSTPSEMTTIRVPWKFSNIGRGDTDVPILCRSILLSPGQLANSWIWGPPRDASRKRLSLSHRYKCNQDGLLDASLYQVLKKSKDGDLFELSGDIHHICNIAGRLWSILNGLRVSRSQKWDCYCRWVVRFRGGKTHLKIPPPYGTFEWPEEIADMLEGSGERVVFVPAFFLVKAFRSLRLPGFCTGTGWYDGSEYIGSRFVQSRTRLRDPTFHCMTDVFPAVFVPYPSMLDLLASAALEASSPLLGDLAQGRIFEPCTGTGILAGLMLRLGAKEVHCTDIDSVSCDCARHNALRWRMEKRAVIHNDHNWMPEEDQQIDAVIVNPPWYSDVPEELRRRATPENADYYMRCTVDFRRELLIRLLTETSPTVRKNTPFYLFVGADDAFSVSSLEKNTARIDLGQLGWEIREKWDNAGLKLYRLCPITQM